MKTLLLVATTFVVSASQAAINYQPPSVPTGYGWIVDFENDAIVKTASPIITARDNYKYSVGVAPLDSVRYFCDPPVGPTTRIRVRGEISYSDGSKSFIIDGNITGSSGTIWTAPGSVVSYNTGYLTNKEIYGQLTNGAASCKIDWVGDVIDYVSTGYVVRTPTVNVVPETIAIKQQTADRWTAESIVTVSGNKGDRLQLHVQRAPSRVNITFDTIQQTFREGEETFVTFTPNSPSFTFSEPIVITGTTTEPGLETYAINLTYIVT